MRQDAAGREGSAALSSSCQNRRITVTTTVTATDIATDIADIVTDIATDIAHCMYDDD